MHVAVHAGFDRTAALALGLIQLLGDLAGHQHQQPNVVDGGDEEAAQAPIALRRVAGGDRGHGQVAAGCVAGDEVADAGTVVCQKARAIADATDDLGGIFRMVGHHQSGAGLLVPAEAGDAVVPTVQDARLTCRRGRRQHRRPGMERGITVAHEPAEHGNPPGADGVLENRKAQPIDLDNEQARLWFSRAPDVARHKPSDQDAVIGIVVAHRHELGEQAVQDREHDGSPESRRVVGSHPGQRPSQDKDGQELDCQPEGLGHEDRPGHEKPVEDHGAEAVEGQQQQRRQQQHREGVDTQARDHRIRDGQRQTRHQVSQDRATHDRETCRPPLPHEPSLETVWRQETTGCWREPLTGGGFHRPADRCKSID